MSLKMRQVHLDFHTHGSIPGVGADFDPRSFARTLADARVESVTCFARCHHGWLYYDSKLFPERRHPELSRNLLAEQVEACHELGLRVPIYTTVQWDAYTANEHPEWRILCADGRLEGTPPFEPGFYSSLCINNRDYLAFLEEHVREIARTVPLDGIFFDIVFPRECSCPACRRDMSEEGLDPRLRHHRARFAISVVRRFQDRMSELVRSLAPAASIFYNSGHIGTNHRDWKRAYSHFELETLPSGEWGYLHFPVTARYARTLGLEILGQTGKFHGSWGDFHSYKNEAALEYECFRMLSLGAACLIGDQLRPRGELEPEVYRRIGKVYAEVERVEPWCVGASPLTEIGVLTPEETEGATVGILPRAIKGATRMLEELACQFDILDSRSDFSRYRLLVLPDRIRVDERLETRLEGFLDAGGAILASFGSGLNDEMTRPVADFLGIEAVDLSRSRDLDGQDARGVYFERNDYAEYLRPGVGFRRGLGDYDLAMYLKGVDISAQPGAKTLAEKRLSYFDRDWRHFCSHRQTPCSGEPGGPAIIKNGRSIYFAHPVFEQYQLNAPLWCKALVSNAIEELLPGPLLRHDGPSGLRATICEQRSPRRLVVHLLYYVPERRGELMDIVEEGIALRGLGLEIRAGSKVTSVRAVPDGGPIPFRELAPGFLSFEAPEFTGRLMLEVNLE